jgi:uncharacterized protein with PQ loop repeat
MTNVTVAYSAIGISIFARFIFMYLLYTKKSVNDLSLTFCLLNIASSGLWIKYSLETDDLPLTVRNTVDGVLLSISAAYIIRNKCIDHRLNNPNAFKHTTPYMITNEPKTIQNGII